MHPPPSRMQLRGTIERAIADIAAGRATKDQVLQSAIEHFKRDFITAQSKTQARGRATPVIGERTPTPPQAMWRVSIWS